MFHISISGLKIPVTCSVASQWAVMILIMILTLVATYRINEIPRGKQVLAEYFVEKINDMVNENMGKGFESFTPYIGTLAIYLLFINLTGIVGFKPPTSDYSVALGLAIITFVVIHYTSIRRQGIGHYLTGYARPYAFMLLLNIIERLFQPVSLSLRLFGNITASYILVGLIYDGLESLSHSLGLGIPIFETLLPIPFHLYFDLFDGAIQMFIFVMLTMIFTKVTAEH